MKMQDVRASFRDAGIILVVAWAVICLCALLGVGCAVDTTGVAFGGRQGGASGMLERGTGGTVVIASGGALGSSGGTQGTGGVGDTIGTGGITGTGGVQPADSGGVIGTGGSVVVTGSGGEAATGGAIGTGGAGGVAPTGNVKVQFTCSSSPDKRTAVQVWRIVNATGATIPMSEWDLVYWYTANGHLPAEPTCDLYNGIPCAPGQVTISALTRTINRPEADSYINVHFSAAGAATYVAHLQTSFHYFDFAPIDFSDDYSCDLSSADVSTWEKSEASLKDWMKVGLYQNGVLVWGVEP